MKSYKDGKYLIFKFDDGKDVRYDLSNGETIGKTGKPVKSICTQLKNESIVSVIDSFENENYRRFLKFVDENFINRSSSPYSYCRVNKIRNLGTFLSRIQSYSHFEQFFACGIKKIDRGTRYKISDVPSGLISLCKKYNLCLDDNLINTYKSKPNDFKNFLSIDFNSVNISNSVIPLLTCPNGYYSRNFHCLINEHNYNPLSLLKYLDNLMTYEAIERFEDLLRELKDYAAMMSKLSNKFEKYPRNFLTTFRIAARNYNRLKEQFVEEDFQKRIDNSLEYSYGDYKIIYPNTVQDIRDEAVCQNNCLASYINKVINGTCHILFLRKKDSIDKSLVTLEVRNYKCVQYKRRYNAEPIAEELFVIEKYNKYLLKLKEKEVA